MLKRVAPYTWHIVAVLIPLAGLVLALLRFAEKDHREGQQLLAAAILGVFLYAIVLSAV